MALITIDNGDTGLSIRQKLNEIILKLPEIDGKLSPADNLESLTNKATARANLQLGTMAVQNADDVSISDGSVIASTLGFNQATFGAVTQLTNKGTGVTLNTMTGRITMHNAALLNNAAVDFVLTNSMITADDLVLVNVSGGGTAGAYIADVCCVQAGGVRIKLQNISAGSLSEPVEILFAVLRVG
jgi:hypothetical protein